VTRETDSVRPQAATSGRIADYRLDHLIGRGGMAAVYVAQDERSDRTVALKVLAPELARDDAFRTRFLRESRAAAAVANPHILPVYDVGEAGGSLYLAMRYVRGGDVRSLLNRLGPLPVAWAWNTVAQVASALDAAHAHGLVHRDVKPANLLLDAGRAANGSGAEGSDLDHVYLSDFGIRKDPPPGGMIAMGKFVGNLDYVAPEQIEGRALDGRADLYALACAGFELLCGSPPFGQDPGLTVMYAQLYAPPPSATVRRPDLPAPVDQVLATALAKNPADRYPTCAQFADELRAALGLRPDEPVTPAPLRSPGRGEPAAAAVPPAAWPALARPRDPEPQTVRLAGPAPAPPAAGWNGTQDGAPPAGPGPGSEAAAAGLTGHYPEQPRRMSGGLRLVLAAAAAVVVAAVVVVALALTSRSAPAARPQASSPASSPSPSPSPSAATVAARQAAAVNQLLGTSGATRKSLQGAVSDAGHCTNLPSAVSRIQSVVNQRDTEYHRALKLTTTALPHGAAVKSNLTAALRGSLNADRAYLTWAQQQLANGCVPTSQSSAYSTATAAGAQADAAKQAFVQVWNPVAARYGVPRTSPISI